MLDVVSQGSSPNDGNVSAGMAVGAVYGVSTSDDECGPCHQYGCGTAAGEGQLLMLHHTLRIHSLLV